MGTRFFKIRYIPIHHTYDLSYVVASSARRRGGRAVWHWHGTEGERGGKRGKEGERGGFEFIPLCIYIHTYIHHTTYRSIKRAGGRAL